MIKPLWDPIWGSSCPQSAKNGKTTWHCIETILSGKVLRFNTYSHPNFGISLNSLLTEKTEKFLWILFLEIFKLDFRIPGKILSGFLVHYIFWRLVTSVTPLGVMGVTKHQNMCRTKNPLKIFPGIRKSS